MLKLGLSIILLAFALSCAGGCANMPPDFAACTELELNKGYCVMTVSGRSGYVTDQQKILDPDGNTEYTWFDLRPTLISIPYYDFVKLKAYIIKECKKTNECDKRISSWDRSLDNIDSVIKNKSAIPR